MNSSRLCARLCARNESKNITPYLNEKHIGSHLTTHTISQFWLLLLSMPVFHEVITVCSHSCSSMQVVTVAAPIIQWGVKRLQLQEQTKFGLGCPVPAPVQSFRHRRLRRTRCDGFLRDHLVRHGLPEVLLQRKQGNVFRRATGTPRKKGERNRN